MALALWVFGESDLHALRDALSDGRLLWVVSKPMLDEFWHEVRAERCTRYGTTPEAVRRRVEGVPLESSEKPMAPLPPANAGQLRCSDPDDQMFVDLALAERVPWLLSRDRAVLKLRRAAARQGLTICTPQAWVAGQVLIHPA